MRQFWILDFGFWIAPTAGLVSTKHLESARAGALLPRGGTCKCCGDGAVTLEDPQITQITRIVALQDGLY